MYENVIQAQDKSEIITVKGTITDTDRKKIREVVSVMSIPYRGEPIPIRSIPYYGEGLCFTDNGIYKISLEAEGTLLFSAQGYFQKEVKVENRTEINVVLEKDNRIVIFVLGRVVDEQGKPLKGVVISPNRHPKEIYEPAGFRVDNNGTFHFMVAEDSILTFSLEGYETQSIAVNKRDEINVVMKKLKE